MKSDVMNIIHKGEITFLKFKSLSGMAHINHAVSTRHGGVSVIPGLQSLNLGSHTADSKENIQENYRRFCDAAGFDVQRVVLGNQTHSTNVRVVTGQDLGKGVFKHRDYTDVDALVTNIKRIPLVIHTADCVPVAFADKKGRAIGNAHCGWKGTFGRLAEVTLKKLFSEYGVLPCDLVCTIGPCICQSCYEVSEDLFESFVAKFGESDALKKENDKFYIDLSAINKQILIECGVNESDISVSDICTCCNTNHMYSHRGQGPSRGILASVIELI